MAAVLIWYLGNSMVLRLTDLKDVGGQLIEGAEVEAELRTMSGEVVWTGALEEDDAGEYSTVVDPVEALNIGRYRLAWSATVGGRTIGSEIGEWVEVRDRRLADTDGR